MQAEFEATIKAAPATPNAAVAGLCSLVREQAALTIEDLKGLEMWLMIKVPEVSDGNNFGVDVQNFVLGELKTLRTEVTAMLDCVSAYHGAKAAVLEKLVKRVGGPTVSSGVTWEILTYGREAEGHRHLITGSEPSQPRFGLPHGF